MNNDHKFASFMLGVGKLLQLAMLVILSSGLYSCSVFITPDPIDDNEIVVAMTDGNRAGLSIYDSKNLRFKSTLWDEYGAFDPSWSPHGERIVFSTTQLVTTLGHVLYIVDRRTGETETLSSFIDEEGQLDIWGSNSSWSKQANTLAFLQCTSCSLLSKTRIRLVDMETRTQLPFADIEALGFSWSRDGSQIAFTSQEFGEIPDRRKVEVMTSTVGTEIATRLSNTEGLVTSARPTWSENDTHIAYVVDYRTVLRHDVTTGRVDTLWNSSANESILGTIQYSNNGDVLAIGFGSGKVVILDSDAKIIQTYELPANNRVDGSLISGWSPDDSGVLISLSSRTSDIRADLYFLIIETGEIKKLVGSEGVNKIDSEWKPNCGFYPVSVDC